MTGQMGCRLLRLPGWSAMPCVRRTYGGIEAKKTGGSNGDSDVTWAVRNFSARSRPEQNRDNTGVAIEDGGEVQWRLVREITKK